MKYRLLAPALIGFIALVQACAGLPRINAPQGPAGPSVYPSVYPQDRWQFVHTIEAVPPDGSPRTMLGISTISSSRRTIHCVLMSVEGLVLFEGLYDGMSNGGRLTVRRALPPFDAGGFAQGLIDDIRLIFLAPEGPPRQAGILENGARVWRFDADRGGTLDLIPEADGGWQLHLYDSAARLRRTVAARPRPAEAASDQGFPHHLELDAPGVLGYKLTLTLVEARALPANAND